MLGITVWWLFIISQLQTKSYKQRAFETNDQNVVNLPSPLSNFLVVERVQGQRIKLFVLIFSFSDSLILYLTDCSANENWVMTVTLKPKAPKESVHGLCINE